MSAKAKQKKVLKSLPEKSVKRTRKARKQQSATIVSAKQANGARAGFHEEGSGVLGKIASTLYDFQNPKIDGVSYTKEDMMKRKFEWRKRYDKLSLITRKKKDRLRQLEEEFHMLQEADLSTEQDSHSAQATLHQLEMKLNTITIKINEAERNCKTYELNISNIKDESQETHKQLDIQRRQLAHEENLRKKIVKFGKFTASQKETAQSSIKEFKTELGDWRNFLRMIVESMTELTRGKEASDTKQREQEKKKADDIKRSKTMKKVEELLEKLEEKNEEMLIHSEVRKSLEREIQKYKSMFDKIKKATNKEDPQDIIIKFQLNSEVRGEYENIRDRKESRAKEMEGIYKEKLAEFLELTANKEDHTWREVDALQEELQVSEANLTTKMNFVSQINTTLEQLKEWMTSIIAKYNKYLDEWDGVEDRITQANRDDVMGVLNALQTRITTFRQIIQHQNNGTEIIFTKKN